MNDAFWVVVNAKINLYLPLLSLHARPRLLRCPSSVGWAAFSREAAMVETRQHPTHTGHQQECCLHGWDSTHLDNHVGRLDASRGR